MWTFILIIVAVFFILAFCGIIKGKIDNSKYEEAIAHYCNENGYTKCVESLHHRGILYKNGVEGISVVEPTMNTDIFSIKNYDTIFPSKVLCWQNGLMVVDEKHWIISIFRLNSDKDFQQEKIEFPIDKIINVQLIKHGHTVYNRSTMRTISGAVVGGALLGGAGSVVGGMSGDVSSNDVVDEVKIKILIEDLNNPTVLIEFWEENEGYQVKDVFDIILNKQEKLNTKDNQQVINKLPEKDADNYSLADELLKLSKLKEQGVLTEKEFESQKRKLLDK